MSSLAVDGSLGQLRPSERLEWIWAAFPLWMAYALIFAGTQATPLGRALIAGAANVVPLIVLALICRRLLPTLVVGRPAAVQGLIHSLAGALFSGGWYLSLTLLLALTDWARGAGFQLKGFAGPALSWQVFQGGILYCAVAATVLRHSVALHVDRSPAPLERYLVRDGDEFRPMEVSDIFTIRGAQDYAEVSTASGRHLVRMSLAHFEERLDPQKFVRVHRSSIVHLKHLERVEPAGSGRMLAHMANGERVAVSRAGAQALRLLVV